MAWLVAGLGNPDQNYLRSRHNLGRMVVEQLASDSDERFRKVRFLPIELAEAREGDEQLLLARSLRYMNESGPGYASLAKKRGIEPDRVVAVHDELDLNSGALQIKVGGSTAGHNGVRSLQSALGTQDFYRVRIGIGRPPGRQDPADFVLEPIPKKLDADIAILVDDAAEAVRALVREGLERAQDRFNRGSPR